MIARLAERHLKTKFGTFTEILYYDGQTESIALVMGDVEAQENLLCRVHSSCIGGHVFSSVECDCRDQLETSQAMIEHEGKGVVIYLDQEGKGNGHLALIKSIPFKEVGMSQSEAYIEAGFAADARSYRPAAEILNELKIRSVVMLTDNIAKADELRQASIVVTGTKEISTPT